MEADSPLLTVPEAAAYLRIGEDLAYELIRQNRLPHIRLGRVIRVPRFGLEQWIARQAGLEAAPAPTADIGGQGY